MNKDSKVLILGARGLVGSALVRELEKQGHTNILTPFREELDLEKNDQVEAYFAKNKPEVVVLAAAMVGGIHANNTYRADFILNNLTIQANVMNAALRERTPKFLFLGSSCIYPRECPQPIKEEYLLTSPLEKTNEPYAIAKIAGLKTTESVRRQYGLNWFSVMPTNLYGENDNYHLENSHVIPGLIARMHQSKVNGDLEFKVWGTGKPKREFLYVDDLARACLYLLNYQGELPDVINVGMGEDISIAELASMIKEKIGHPGKLTFDTSKPDGTPRKVLDIGRIKSLGWNPTISLSEGLDIAIKFYLKQKA